MRTILIALFALILLGCESSLDRQHREALGRLEAVDNEELVKGVALILALPEEQKTFDLPRDLWTPEIVKLEPVAVRYYGDGVAILIKKWVSKESGFYVAPGGRVERGSDPQIGVRRKITKEIDWYAL